MSDPSTPLGAGQIAVSRFVEFTRAEWAKLRASTPLPLTEPQLRRLVSVNERMSLDEVAAHTGILSYNLTCSVAPRVPRTYN